MNKLKKSLALVLALCMVVAVTACQKSNEGAVEEGVKAKVNDKVITQEEYDEHLSVYKKMLGIWKFQKVRQWEVIMKALC